MIKSKDYTIIVIMIYLRYLRLELVWFATTPGNDLALIGLHLYSREQIN